MLYWIAENLETYWGPLRLLRSFFFLNLFGFFLSAVVCLFAMPRLWHLLPRDKGRDFAVNSEKSIGKPVSAGVLFIPIFVIMAFLFAPFDGGAWQVMPLVLAGMVVGFVDDRSGGLSEYTLAALDLLLSILVALVVVGTGPVTVWLPFISGGVTLASWIYLPVAIGVLWVSINATNCTDGVDGLSASLTGVSFSLLAFVLYVVVGNASIAEHLLIPFDQFGSSWSVLGFVMAGCLGGYLWHNAPPSAVLMGDSGSRPLGLLLGALVLATNNPVFILVIGTVIVVNGATGLVKVALLRFFKIGLFHNIRFPLHDHVRKNMGWSDSQVIVRFTIIHLSVSALLLALVLKVR